MAEIETVFESTRGFIDQMEEIIEQYQQRSIEEERQGISAIAIGTYSTLAIEWALLLGGGLLLIRQISRAVERMRLKTHRVSEGFLEVPEAVRYTDDELGRTQQDMDGMILRIRELVEEITSSARAVSASSDELAVSANESASSSSHVAANIQEVTGLVESQSSIILETNRAIEELTIGVQRIAESASAIAVHAEETNNQAQQGNELLMQLKQQMDVTADEISRLSGTVALLNDKSAEIGAITEKITALAKQTGILSLNASIEAARAGEHGRGFAVVAGEIRKLADHSLASAENIHILISDTQQEITNASEQMRNTITQAERSASLLQEVGKGFLAITSSVRQVSEQIHEMSSVTEQMSASSEEISASMDQTAASVREVSGKAENVAAATEEQLALAESIARSADQLRDIVGSLNKAVSYFKIQ